MAADSVGVSVTRATITLVGFSRRTPRVAAAVVDLVPGRVSPVSVAH